jgi:nicotinamide-nucleotide amidase
MTHKSIKELYFSLNKRGDKPLTLSKHFEDSLDRHIERGEFDIDHIPQIGLGIVQQLREYSSKHRVHKVVVGMSGGIDSALTASLFKSAGYDVTGVTMPIHQSEEETERGIAACKALDIEHVHIDLTKAFNYMVKFYKDLDIDFNKELVDKNMKQQAVRKGNIRARLRMITLYNLASKQGGIVGSTDNYSELAAGFWTLHGDVGDVAPIQSLNKSWEVPMLADVQGVPQDIIDAVPTDGLGIDAGDEAQLGFSYAELDIALLNTLHGDHGDNPTQQDQDTIDRVIERIGSTVYKRENPVNFDHPITADWRYQQLGGLDMNLITPNLGED